VHVRQTEPSLMILNLCSSCDPPVVPIIIPQGSMEVRDRDVLHPKKVRSLSVDAGTVDKVNADQRRPMPVDTDTVYVLIFSLLRYNIDQS